MRHIVMTCSTITIKYHQNIPNGFLSYGADMKLPLKPSRGNNSESMEVELSFLYVTHQHYQFYIAVKYHGYIFQRVFKL